MYCIVKIIFVLKRSNFARVFFCPFSFNFLIPHAYSGLPILLFLGILSIISFLDQIFYFVRLSGL